ncbi:hypothetical protein ACHAWF_011596 [Thalassiosira exigua]
MMINRIFFVFMHGFAVFGLRSNAMKGAVAFASYARSSLRKSTLSLRTKAKGKGKAKVGVGGGAGFIRKKEKQTPNKCDPALYSPRCVDACHQVLDSKRKSFVVPSKDVRKGQVLTLFPVHALGLRMLHRNADAKKKKKHKRDDTEYVMYDVDRDGYYFREGNQLRT